LDEHEQSFRELIEKQPLFLFSLYTQIQVDALRRLRERLKQMEPLRNEQNFVQGGAFGEYYDYFWFWVLGAYEVIRVMDEHKDCFAGEIKDQLPEVKRRLNRLRVPFAKQDIAGRKPAKPPKFYAENSVASVNTGLVFIVGQEEFESSSFMDDVLAFLGSIRAFQILAEMPINRPPR
jgi:hypothetical protein